MSTSTVSGLSPNVEYRTVAGFQGYVVGADGSLWSNRINVPRGKGKGRGCASGFSDVYHRVGQNLDDDGYCRCSLKKDGRKHSRRVHILVLEAFAGPRPEGMEVCHFPDRTRTNNRIENLRWGTDKDNANDRTIHGTFANRKGEAHPLVKLTDADVVEIRRLRETGMYLKDIAARFPVGPQMISLIVRRIRWTHIP